MVTEQKILEWLEEVKDPEIPVLSLIDLGVIQKVDIATDQSVRVTMTPTFSGCPAMDVMKQDVEDTLEKNGIDNYEVCVSFETPWNSERISDKGRAALKEFGLAPPPKNTLIVDIDVLSKVSCPFCDSNNTRLTTPFGPTLCRSMHYCDNCKQAFEQFKPVE